MKQDSQPDLFKVKNFSPHELMPVAWIGEEWANNRLLAWSVLNHASGGLGRLERAIAPLLPLVLMGSLSLLIFSLQFQFSTSGSSTFGSVFSNPVILLSTIFLSFTLVLTYRVTKAAERLRNVADKTIFSLMDTWIKSRYGLAVDYGDNLIKILNSEPIIINSTSDGDYFLGTVSQYGETVLLVRNVDGKEAPLLLQR